MIVNSRNYETTADFLIALIETLGEDAKVYLNRVKYDLERTCLRADYFANILQYHQFEANILVRRERKACGTRDDRNVLIF